MSSDAFVLNVDSALGPFGVEGTERVVTALYLPHEGRRSSAGLAPKAVANAARQVEEYLRGERRHFAVALATLKATDFQRDVFAAIAAIPYGEVRTYGDVAASVARPLAHRAVGNVCNTNPYPLVVPCHRVVASNGIGGYGGGDAVKRFLLALEGVHY